MTRSARGPKPLGFARWAILGFCGLAAMGALAARAVETADAPGGRLDRAQAMIKTARVETTAAYRQKEAAEAAVLIRAALDEQPNRADIWARLAYAQAVNAGRLGPDAADSLMKSYKLAPYDSGLLIWRTNFVFGNWESAPAGLRNAAFEEVSAFARFNVHYKALSKIAPNVDDPSGRFALMVALEGAARPKPQ